MSYNDNRKSVSYKEISENLCPVIINERYEVFSYGNLGGYYYVFEHQKHIYTLFAYGNDYQIVYGHRDHPRHRYINFEEIEKKHKIKTRRYEKRRKFLWR